MSWWLFLYSIAIPAYAPFARKIMSVIPNKVFVFYIASVVFFLFYFAFFLKGKTIPVVLSLPVLFMAGYVVFPLRLIEEKVHILEFMGLGLFAGMDRKLKIHPLVLVLAVALIDEGFQYILPRRYFDLRDVGLAVIGGFLGWLLAIISFKFGIKKKI